jgi:hypothetical protein
MTVALLMSIPPIAGRNAPSPVIVARRQEINAIFNLLVGPRVSDVLEVTLAALVECLFQDFHIRMQYRTVGFIDHASADSTGWNEAASY